jgi:hypothetical protein
MWIVMSWSNKIPFSEQQFLSIKVDGLVAKQWHGATPESNTADQDG